MKDANRKTNPYRSSRLFGRLWSGWLHRYRGLMALAFVIMVIEGSTLGALSWMIKPLFDKVFEAGEQSALIWVGTAILALFLIRAVTSITSKTLMTSIAQKSSARMQADLLRHILTLDAGLVPESEVTRVETRTGLILPPTGSDPTDEPEPPSCGLQPCLFLPTTSAES